MKSGKGSKWLKWGIGLLVMLAPLGVWKAAELIVPDRMCPHCGIRAMVRGDYDGKCAYCEGFTLRTPMQ